MVLKWTFRPTYKEIVQSKQEEYNQHIEGLAEGFIGYIESCIRAQVSDNIYRTAFKLDPIKTLGSANNCTDEMIVEAFEHIQANSDITFKYSDGSPIVELKPESIPREAQIFEGDD